jgi:hypothetical protein
VLDALVFSHLLTCNGCIRGHIYSYSAVKKKEEMRSSTNECTAPVVMSPALSPDVQMPPQVVDIVLAARKWVVLRMNGRDNAVFEGRISLK